MHHLQMKKIILKKLKKIAEGSLRYLKQKTQKYLPGFTCTLYQPLFRPCAVAGISLGIVRHF